jgi:hypothetical protein
MSKAERKAEAEQFEGEEIRELLAEKAEIERRIEERTEHLARLPSTP